MNKIPLGNDKTKSFDIRLGDIESYVNNLDLDNSSFRSEVNQDISQYKLEISNKVSSIPNEIKAGATYHLKERKPLVTFIDDDGSRMALTKLYPVFNAKNAVANCAIITGNMVNSVAGYLNSSDVKYLASQGWEMLGHSRSHNPNLSIYTNDVDLDFQLGAGCKSELEALGLKVNGFVFPQSVSDIRIRRFTKKYYQFAFANSGINSGDFVDSMRITRIAYGAWTSTNPTVNGNSEKNTLAYYKACVDYSIANKSWLVFMLHCSDSANGFDDTQYQILGDLIDYIKAQSVEIVTVSEGYKAFGNNIFVGDLDSEYTAINEKGLFVNEKIPMNAYTSATLLSGFPKRQVTKFWVDSSGAPGFPGNSSGLVVTYNYNDLPGISRQEFKPRYDSKTYIRYVNADGSWSSFYRVIDETQVIATTYNQYTASTSISTFPKGIFSFWVNGAGASGFPDGSAGTCTVYRLGGNGYDRQEFRKYLSNELWSRYVDASGNYTTWVKISAV